MNLKEVKKRIINDKRKIFTNMSKKEKDEYFQGKKNSQPIRRKVMEMFSSDDLMMKPTKN